MVVVVILGTLVAVAGIWFLAIPLAGKWMESGPSFAYNEARDYIIANDPAVRHFATEFPESNHYISYFDGSRGRPSWNSETLMDGNVRVWLKFPLKFAHGAPLPATSCAIYYADIVSVLPGPDGSQAEVYGNKSGAIVIDDWYDFIEDNHSIRMAIKARIESGGG